MYKTTCDFLVYTFFSVLMLNNINAQMILLYTTFSAVETQIMYNPKIDQCTTVLQKRSKLTTGTRKQQPAIET